MTEGEKAILIIIGVFFGFPIAWFGLLKWFGWVAYWFGFIDKDDI